MADQTIPSIKNLRGNIGIGLANPATPLAVKVTSGNLINLGSSAPASTLQVGSASSTLFAAIGSRQSNTSQSGLGILTSTPDASTATYGDMFFSVRRNNDNDFATTASKKAFSFLRYTTSLMTILRDGKVGIGTASPNAKLDISSDDEIVAIFSSTDNKSIIQLSDDDTNIYLSAENSRASLGFYQGAHVNNLNFYNNNLGIGTATPAEKLHVDSGNIQLTNGNYIIFDGPTPKTTKMRSYYDGSQTHIAMTVANTAVLDLRADGLSTFSGDVVIGGGLTINGTTTTINSTTLQVDDKNIELGTVATPSDTTADGGGITLKGASDYYIKWQNSTNSWHFNQGITTGADGSGKDVKFFGATSGRYLLWDESANALTGAYDLKIADSREIQLGGSNDLRLYHSHPNNYIKANSGDLVIQSDNDDLKLLAEDDIVLRDNDDSTNFIHCVNGGPVRLYHNGSQRLETTASGVTISGLSLELFHSGGNNYISSAASGSHLLIRNTGGANVELLVNTTEKGVIAKPNGAVELYHDNGHRLSTTVDGISLHGNGYVDLPDNGRLRLGTNNDMMFYHASGGSGNNILDFQNHDGLIRNLANDKLFIFQTTSGGSQYEILRLGGSGVDARFSQHVSIGSSGTPKDLTTYGSTSARYMKWDGSADLLNFMDNVKITIGNSNDLQLFHDGTHSKITNNIGTGSLYIQSHNSIQLESGNGEDMITCAANGAVSLFHDNVKKFETTADGVQVTGDILAYTASGQYFQLDKSDNSLKLSDNVKLKIGTGSDLQLYHDGNNSTIYDQGSGSLIVATNSFKLLSANQAEQLITAFEDGAVNLFHNNTTRLQTTSTGVRIIGDKFGIYQGIEEDNYYFDSYNGARNVSAILNTQRADIIRYQSFQNLESWNGSAWVDASSQNANLKNLLDGRTDTMWNVPSTYYKFRFEVSASTDWPLRALIGLQTSWSGSTFPECEMIVEEKQTDGTWATKVTAQFTSANGITGWGTMLRADSALHTGRGMTFETRITIDFYGWTPSNSSYTTIPLQNILISSNYSGNITHDTQNLLNYDRDILAPADLTVTGKSLFNGAEDNSGKADFAVGTGGNPQISWRNSQVQIGHTDQNWDGKVYLDGTFNMASWSRHMRFFTQSSTSNAYDIFWETWNGSSLSEKMRLKGDGKLGIGTSAPAQKLHLEFANTDTSFSGGTGGAWGSEGLLIENTSSNTNTMAMIQLRTGDADLHIAGIRQGQNDPDLGFFFESQEKIRFTKDGHVGIGTSSPATTLHVYDSAGPTIRFERGSASKLDFEFGSTNTSLVAAGEIQFRANGGTTNKFVINNSLITSNATTYINADLGLGVSSPVTKLDVRGGVFISGNHTDTGNQLNVWCDSNGYGNLSVYNFCIKTGANNSRTNPFFISHIGSVGIGTTSINTGIKLQVAGGVYATTGYVYAKFIRADYFSSGQNLELQSGGSGKVQLRTSNTVQLEANNDGCTRLSSVGSTTGGKFLVRTYSGNDYLNVFSSEYSSGSLCLGYGAAGKSGAAGFVSTYDNFSGHKSIFKVNHNGITVLTTGNAAVDTVGDDLSMAERFSVKVDKAYFATGNVGIGTENPTTKLEVSSSGAHGINISQDTGNSALSGRLFLSTGTTNQACTLFNNGGTLRFATGAHIGNSSGSTRMTLLADGKLGVGTTSPLGTVHIFTADAGAAIATNTSHDDLIIENGGNCGIQLSGPASSYQYLAFGDTASANQGYVRYYHTDNRMDLRAGGTDTLSLVGGKVGIKTTSPTEVLDVVGLIKFGHTRTDNAQKIARLLVPEYNNSHGSFLAFMGTANQTSNAVSYGGGTSSADAATLLLFYTASAVNTTVGTERMRITSDGKVGIGTQSPQQDLDVDGVIKQKVYTVSNLPTAGSSTIGARAFVSDSYYAFSSSYLGSQISGGGSNFSPVYSDGSYWYMG